MSLLNKWNKAWDDRVVRLVPHPLTGGLEGASTYDQDMCRRARCSVLRTEQQYEVLSRVLGEWGYCVETPMNFQFKS